jgi:ADP-dependent NAD(P)H-hydrate dehydratase
MRSPARLDDTALRGWPLPTLDPGCDKEARGRVLIVAGSRETPGAARLAATAALRAGAGKVMVATADAVAASLALAMPELRVIGLPETAAGGLAPQGAARLEPAAQAADVLLVGPGLQDEDAAVAFAAALRQLAPAVPLLLDAAAMGAALRPGAAGAPCCITPHAGEMAHLSGAGKDVVQADPLHAALAAAGRWRTTVVLKGATTLIADVDRVWQHEGGNLGLATAGSGDVLAGVLAGLVARGATLVQAAAWAVALHARAGERLAERVGPIGYLASELPAEVPALLHELSTVH